MKNIDSSEQLNELFTALAKAQADMPVVGKNKINPFFKSNYAGIEDMVMATRPCLSKNGLSVIYPPLIETESGEYMSCILCHSSGQWIKGVMKVSPTKADIQSLGSYKSYLRRYLYQDMTGCVTVDEDDDAETVMKNNGYRPQPITNNSSDKIRPDQVKEIERGIKGYSEIRESILESANCADLSELTQSQFKSIVTKLPTMVSAFENASR